MRFSLKECLQPGGLDAFVCRAQSGRIDLAQEIAAVLSWTNQQCASIGAVFQAVLAGKPHQCWGIFLCGDFQKPLGPQHRRS
jgi:hypothetical protein